MAGQKSNWLKTTQGNVLLMEGVNDCHVTAALCQAHHISENLFGFYNCEGDENLFKRLVLLLKNRTASPAVLGLVLDADAPNLAGKWQRLTTTLQQQEFGYELPAKPNPKGTVLKAPAPDLPRIGIWLMPDNTIDGMLEDFCLTLAPKAALNHTEAFLQQATEQGFASFKPVHHAKAKIHTWLGTQDEPGTPLGQAITKKVLKPDTELAKTYVGWLKRVFEEKHDE